MLRSLFLKMAWSGRSPGIMWSMLVFVLGFHVQACSSDRKSKNAGRLDSWERKSLTVYISDHVRKVVPPGPKASWWPVVVFAPATEPPPGAHWLYRILNHTDTFSEFFLRERVRCDRMLRNSHGTRWSNMKYRYSWLFRALISVGQSVLPGRGFAGSSGTMGHIRWYGRPRRHRDVWVARGGALEFGRRKHLTRIRLQWKGSEVYVSPCVWPRVSNVFLAWQEQRKGVRRGSLGSGEKVQATAEQGGVRSVRSDEIKTRTIRLKQGRGIVLPRCRDGMSTGEYVFVLLKAIHPEGAVFYVQGPDRVLGVPARGSPWRTQEIAASLVTALWGEKDSSFLYVPQFMWAYRRSMPPDDLEGLFRRWWSEQTGMARLVCMIGVSGIAHVRKRLDPREILDRRWLRWTFGTGCLTVGSLGPSPDVLLKNLPQGIEVFKARGGTRVLLAPPGMTWGRCSDGDESCQGHGMAWEGNARAWIYCSPEGLTRLAHALLSVVHRESAVGFGKKKAAEHGRKPDSVPEAVSRSRAAPIPLGPALPQDSCGHRKDRSPGAPTPKGRLPSALLQVGFTVTPPVTRRPVRSYRTLSPLPVRRAGRRFAFCGTFLRLSPTGRYPAPFPEESGLSSDTTRMPASASPPLLPSAC